MNLVTNLKDKDGGDEETITTYATIEVVANGWILKVTDENEEEYTEVYTFDKSKDLLDAIQIALGAGQ